MDWTRITSKLCREKKPSLEVIMQEYFIDMTADLNLRLLCEGTDGQMLWIESIAVTSCESALDAIVKGMTASFRKRIKNCLLGRGR